MRHDVNQSSASSLNWTMRLGGEAKGEDASLGPRRGS